MLLLIETTTVAVSYRVDRPSSKPANLVSIYVIVRNGCIPILVQGCTTFTLLPADLYFFELWLQVSSKYCIVL